MKRIKYVLLLVLILVVIGLVIRALILHNGNSNKAAIKTLSSKVNINSSFTKSISFNWQEIDIKPFPTLEGSYYTFTSFDVLNDSIIAFAGSYDKNVIMFINVFNKQKLSTIELELPPLDILNYNDTLYVLNFKNIQAIKNNRIIANYPIENTNIYNYDKLIDFYGKLSLLMANGSSYCFNRGKFIKKDNLSFINNEIWIEKTHSNSFSLRNELNNKLLEIEYSSKIELGSITIAGGTDRIFCCIDKILSNDPIRIVRYISSSLSNFNKDLLELPISQFSYVKNDFKIHNNIIYYLVVDQNGVILNINHLKQ